MFVTSCSNTNEQKLTDVPVSPAYDFKYDAMMEEVVRLAEADNDKSAAVSFLKNYYSNGGSPIFAGEIALINSVLESLEDAKSHGLSPRYFETDSVKKDIERLRTFNIDDTLNSATQAVGRIEYNLAKAYMTYGAGMRYGFVNPHKVFNRRSDGKEGSHVFNAEIENPDSAFFAQATRQKNSANIKSFLDSLVPTDSLYVRLKGMLAKTDKIEERQRIICNMERCRWRNAHPLLHDGKYVVVNIPAQHLYAFGGDTILDMRIVCGDLKHKTPLLNSKIERMDVNPPWIVTTNIIKKELAYHAGDSAYFARNRYVIQHRGTGDTIAAKDLTFEMLRSGRYSVIQERGPGNSLGRIAFRFPNPFSVYLHDTSTRSAFNKEVRTLSHGCVRVAKPLDLAIYMLSNKDEWTIDKLRISMGFAPKTSAGKEWLKEKNQKLAGVENPPRYHSLITHKEVSPKVPLFITYYTMYYDQEGRLQTHPDIYGYDAMMVNALKPMVQL